jgi:hypothetical protein
MKVKSEEAEKIKDIILDTAEKSKETIHKIIEANSTHIGAALDSHKKIVESIKNQLEEQEIESGSMFIQSLKKMFGKSIEISEDLIDSVINAYSKQVEFNIDYNTKLIDSIKNSGGDSSEKLLQLVRENFDSGIEVVINNTNTIIDSYNKHANLALNFNKKIAENLSIQMENVYKIQGHNLKLSEGWASDWWNSELKETF